MREDKPETGHWTDEYKLFYLGAISITGPPGTY